MLILRYFRLIITGSWILKKYTELFSEKTRLVAFTHVSNTLGTVNPVKEMISHAHKHNVPVLVDGAQAIQHGHVDVTGYGL